MSIASPGPAVVASTVIHAVLPPCVLRGLQILSSHVQGKFPLPHIRTHHLVEVYVRGPNSRWRRCAAGDAMRRLN